ncbi:hypothetical protein DESC_480248 [Desulfosarcina cetonica]|nr:hypothetical protein DESC_480248 [Desulfosarcina cetonica]
MTYLLDILRSTSPNVQRSGYAASRVQKREVLRTARCLRSAETLGCVIFYINIALFQGSYR